MTRITVLYDGWSLIYRPNSPAALHLLMILNYLPPTSAALVALPGLPPAWFPVGATPVIAPTPDTPKANLVWEQRILPRLLRESRADFLHTVSPTAPLFGFSVVSSPAGFFEDTRRSGWFDHWREAFAQGGLSRTRAVFWPADLPKPAGYDRIFSLPAVVHPDFYQPITPELSQELVTINLPETYVLYHGPGSRAALLRTFDAWSWAAASVGSYYPLVMLGLDPAARQEAQSLIADTKLEGCVQVLPVIPPGLIALVYQRSTQLFHPAPLAAWGEPVRQALACGKPVVASTSAAMEALVGDAAYLVSQHDSRALGAALITIIVESEVVERLTLAARKRSAAWEPAKFQAALAAVYQELAG